MTASSWRPERTSHSFGQPEFARHAPGMKRSMTRLSCGAGFRRVRDGRARARSARDHHAAGLRPPGARDSGHGHQPSRLLPARFEADRPLKHLQWRGLQKGVRSCPVLARKPSMRAGRYCIRIRLQPPIISPPGIWRGPVTRASPTATTPAPKVTSSSTSNRRQRRSDGGPAGNRCTKSGSSL